MGDDQDGIPSTQARNQIFHDPAGERIEGATGLTHQQGNRILGEGACDAEALVLSA